MEAGGLRSRVSGKHRWRPSCDDGRKRKSRPSQIYANLRIPDRQTIIPDTVRHKS